MPQAKRSSGQRSGSAAKRAAPGARSTRAGGSAGRGGSAPTSARSSSARSSGRASATEGQLEAVAERLRKLNERIIEAGRQAGETTLTTYEKALKSIAAALARGPGKSEIDWISNLASVQAKFIRELTDTWSQAARKVLK